MEWSQPEPERQAVLYFLPGTKMDKKTNRYSNNSVVCPKPSLT